MNRYIFDKKGLAILGLTSQEGLPLLQSSAIVTNEILHFKSCDNVSAVLTEAQLNLLKTKNISVTPEQISGGVLVADYEQKRSGWYNLKRRESTTNFGVGIKVAVIDTGCNLPVNFGINLVDNNTNITDIFGHGTGTTSIIKSTQHGMANGVQLHFLKAISDTGFLNQSALLAAFDYCINNQIDFINCSFSGSLANFQTVINNLKANNCVVFAAAGNSIVDAPLVQPASLLNVFSCNVITEDGLPIYKNYINNDNPTKGIDFAASGWNSLWVFKNLTLGVERGTSLSSPFMTAAAAIYASKLRELDPVSWANNFKVVEYMKTKCMKISPTQYFGNGIITF